MWVDKQTDIHTDRQTKTQNSAVTGRNKYGYKLLKPRMLEFNRLRN
jgi:hypothetical protein